MTLPAATQGAVPTEGPLTRRFRPGHREQVNEVEYEREREREQAIQMRGQPEMKIEQLRERHWRLLGRGQEVLAETVGC